MIVPSFATVAERISPFGPAIIAISDIALEMSAAIKVILSIDDLAAPITVAFAINLMPTMSYIESVTASNVLITFVISVDSLPFNAAAALHI